MTKANISSLNEALVHADYIDLLRNTINSLRNSTEIQAHAIKAVHLEVNVDTAKHSLIH
jgi:hypothetical protein